MADHVEEGDEQEEAHTQREVPKDDHREDDPGGRARYPRVGFRPVDHTDSERDEQERRRRDSDASPSRKRVKRCGHGHPHRALHAVAHCGAAAARVAT